MLMSATINSGLFASYFAADQIAGEPAAPGPTVAEPNSGGATGGGCRAHSAAGEEEGRRTTAVVEAAGDSGEASGVGGGEGGGEGGEAGGDGTTPATPAPTLHIPGFTHPVSEQWLEDVLEATGHMIEPGSKYARSGKGAEHGGGAQGLGFSEMVALQSGTGRHSAKAKGELRSAISGAARAYSDRAEAAAAGDVEYSPHVHDSIDTMDEDKVPPWLPAVSPAVFPAVFPAVLAAVY